MNLAMHARAGGGYAVASGHIEKGTQPRNILVSSRNRKMTCSHAVALRKMLRKSSSQHLRVLRKCYENVIRKSSSQHLRVLRKCYENVTKMLRKCYENPAVANFELHAKVSVRAAGAPVHAPLAPLTRRCAARRRRALSGAAGAPTGAAGAAGVFSTGRLRPLKCGSGPRRDANC